MADGSFWDVTRRYIKSNSKDRLPQIETPVQFIPAAAFGATPSQEINVYWLGHASLLLEIEGKRFLLYPMLSERASMLQWLGPKRLHPSPLHLRQIPSVDGVIISHNHYDHLDYATIQELAQQAVIFYVPLGLREILQSWGVLKKTSLSWTGGSK